MSLSRRRIIHLECEADQTTQYNASKLQPKPPAHAVRPHEHKHMPLRHDYRTRQHTSKNLHAAKANLLNNKRPECPQIMIPTPRPRFLLLHLHTLPIILAPPPMHRANKCPVLQLLICPVKHCNTAAVTLHFVNEAVMGVLMEAAEGEVDNG